METELEERLVKAEREKAQALRAIIRHLMQQYPAARTDKWLLLWHYANYNGVRIPWSMLDGLRSLPNPDDLYRRRREVINDYYPELRGYTNPGMQRVWRKAYYRPANQLEGY